MFLYLVGLSTCPEIRILYHFPRATTTLSHLVSYVFSSTYHFTTTSSSPSLDPALIIPMSSAVSFLDLPHNVLLKIYGYSGLIRPCPIELNVPNGYDPQLFGGLGGVSSLFKECFYVMRKRGSDRHRVLMIIDPDLKRGPTSQIVYVPGCQLSCLASLAASTRILSQCSFRETSLCYGR